MLRTSFHVFLSVSGKLDDQTLECKTKLERYVLQRKDDNYRLRNPVLLFVLLHLVVSDG